MVKVNLRDLRRTGSHVLFLASMSFQANAYLSTLDTGNLAAPGQYRTSAETQFAAGDFSGFNLVGRFDTGIDDSTSARAVLGTGATVLDAGIYLKWIPIPDYDRQPAIGLLTGLNYSRYQDKNYTSIRFHPLLSKQLETQTAGKFTPYTSLPFGVTFSSAKTVVPLQFVAGTNWQPPGSKFVSFFLEGGLNLIESFSYVSLAVQIDFDSENGIQVE